MKSEPGLNAAIKQQAQDLGFDLVGVAPAGPVPHGDFYARWIDAGHAGEMAYLARNADKRMDPARVLTGARSVIVVGASYFQGDFPPDTGTSVLGRVARYAWGEDYHEALRGRLAQLVSWLRHETGGKVEAKAYVDTGPLMERDLAMLAGLGWIGKNTCLLNARAGSYFFLGAVLLDVPLRPDATASPHCGTCERCLHACPTNAFVAPYVLDARRCISYLTIELRGPIPRELRPLIGNRIFGCDDCQEVCPFNRFAPTARLDELRARHGVPTPDLVELLALDDEGFRQRFRGSAIKRAKRRGLLRNVAVALGNSGDPAAVAPLAQALRADPEPLVRGHAAWAMGCLGGSRATAALRQALAEEPDAWAQDEVRAALAAVSADPPASPSPAGGRQIVIDCAAPHPTAARSWT